MRIGIYPGSFDPLTNGHLDIIDRAQRICDKLIIAIANNISKNPLFSVSERVEIIQNCCGAKEKVTVVAFDGLLADYCIKKKVSFMVRGLRSTTDFEYEYSIAAVNRVLARDIDTVFFMTRGEYSHISSNMVKEIAGYHGDVSALVPRFVLKKIQQKYQKR
ncbi:MAG: pantetheine-phosphate adenylyltransferase [Spirochaetes bacterium]|nr:pantetheine-phosphate adenylyltransferase [Spirochaetota bacterium]